jgi:integrase
MFENYVKWATSQALRANGKPPAPKTLLSKVARLRQACDMLGLDLGSTEGLLGLALAEHLATRTSVEKLLDVLYTRHAPATVMVDVNALRDFGAYAVAQGYIGECALLPSDAPRKLPKKAIEVYSDDEVAKLLLFAEARGSFRHYMLLATVAETGRRVGEMLDLRWQDLRLDATPAHLDLPTTKNGKQQLVPLTSKLRDVVYTPRNLERLRTTPLGRGATRDPDVYLYPMSYNAAWEWLEKLCLAADVPFSGWHRFRHTYATRKLAQGVPINVVSKLLGHSNVGITASTYDHTTSLSFAAYLD